MSQSAVPKASHRPVKFGLPSGIRGICEVVRAGAWPSPGSAVQTTTNAENNRVPLCRKNIHLSPKPPFMLLQLAEGCNGCLFNNRTPVYTLFGAYTFKCRWGTYET